MNLSSRVFIAEVTVLHSVAFIIIIIIIKTTLKHQAS